MTNDPHNTNDQPEEDFPAVDGLLRQLAREENGKDREFVERILESVNDADEEMHPSLVIIPTRYIAVAAAIIVAMALSVWWALKAPERAIVTSEHVFIQHRLGLEKRLRGDALYEGDIILAKGISTFTLDDGSHVTLASGSTLGIEPTLQKQRVHLKLHKGRCFLRVSKGGGSFFVDAGIPVEVLGTVFGIRRADDKTVVSVYEGLVQVGGDTGVRLTRGLSAQVKSSSKHPTNYDLAPNKELDWARPAVSFKKKPLPDILDWISVHSSYRFAINAPELKSMEVSFEFSQGDDIDKAVAEFLELNKLTSDPGLTFSLKD